MMGIQNDLVELDNFMPSSDDGHALEPVTCIQPTHWQVKCLREVLREVDVRAKELKIVESEQTPMLSLTKNYGLIPQYERFIHRVATQDISDYKVIKRGQIVYNPYVIWEGAIHALKEREQGFISPAYLVWEVLDADPYFLDFLLRTPLLLNAYLRVASGVVQRRRAVKKEAFLDIRIPFPPLPEQHAIAHVLQTVQNAIRARRKEIELENERKVALMHHLFTHGIQNEPTKQSEIGEIPENWEVVRLGELLRESLKNGYSARESSSKEGIRTLTLTAVTQNDFSLKNTKLTVAEPLKVRDLWLKSGDIFIERANTPEFVGLAAIYEGTENFAIYPDLLIRVRLQEDRMVPRFVVEFLLSNACRAYFRKNATGTAGNMPKIDHGTVWRTLIPCPPPREQHEIAYVSFACDSKIAALEKELSLHEELFRALLDELMTGRLSPLPLVAE